MVNKIRNKISEIYSRENVLYISSKLKYKLWKLSIYIKCAHYTKNGIYWEKAIYKLNILINIKQVGFITIGIYAKLPVI